LVERRTFGLGRVWLFDIQGWITLLLGGLLALITLFSSYSYVHIPFLGAVAFDQQIGVLLLAALVPALFGDAELATRYRLRTERDRIQAERDRVLEAEERARAADEAAEERNRAALRAQLQNRCALVQLQHQLDPTPEHTQQLRGLIGFLLEYVEFNSPPPLWW
jgi:hypothetical protein